MNRERKIQLLSLVLIGGCVALGAVFQSAVLSVDPPAHAKAAPAERRPPSVEYVNPTVGSIRRAVRLTAEVKAYREALI